MGVSENIINMERDKAKEEKRRETETKTETESVCGGWGGK